MSRCPVCGAFDGHLATCPRTEHDDEDLRLQGASQQRQNEEHAAEQQHIHDERE